jgi:hypothetical protein
MAASNSNPTLSKTISNDLMTDSKQQTGKPKKDYKLLMKAIQACEKNHDEKVVFAELDVAFAKEPYIGKDFAEERENGDGKTPLILTVIMIADSKDLDRVPGLFSAFNWLLSKRHHKKFLVIQESAKASHRDARQCNALMYLVSRQDLNDEKAQASSTTTTDQQAGIQKYRAAIRYLITQTKNPWEVVNASSLKLDFAASVVCRALMARNIYLVHYFFERDWNDVQPAQFKSDLMSHITKSVLASEYEPITNYVLEKIKLQQDAFSIHPVMSVFIRSNKQAVISKLITAGFLIKHHDKEYTLLNDILMSECKGELTADDGKNLRKLLNLSVTINDMMQAIKTGNIDIVEGLIKQCSADESKSIQEFSAVPIFDKYLYPYYTDMIARRGARATLSISDAGNLRTINEYGEITYLKIKDWRTLLMKGYSSTIIMAAAQYSRPAILRLLCEAYPQIVNKGQSYDTHQADDSCIKLVKFFVNTLDVAFMYGEMDCFKILLEHGVVETISFHKMFFVSNSFTPTPVQVQMQTILEIIGHIKEARNASKIEALMKKMSSENCSWVISHSFKRYAEATVRAFIQRNFSKYLDPLAGQEQKLSVNIPVPSAPGLINSFMQPARASLTIHLPVTTDAMSVMPVPLPRMTIAENTPVNIAISREGDVGLPEIPDDPMRATGEIIVTYGDVKRAFLSTTTPPKLLATAAPAFINLTQPTTASMITQLAPLASDAKIAAPVVTQLGQGEPGEPGVASPEKRLDPASTAPSAVVSAPTLSNVTVVDEKISAVPQFTGVSVSKEGEVDQPGATNNAISKTTGAAALRIYDGSRNGFFNLAPESVVTKLSRLMDMTEYLGLPRDMTKALLRTQRDLLMEVLKVKAESLRP